MIDDNGNEMEFTDEDEFRLTPKGFWSAVLMQYGISFAEFDELWKRFEGFALQRLREDEPEASFAAVILDGDGGVIIGAEQRTEETES